MIDTDTAKQILQGDDTHPNILQALGLELLAEVKRLRKGIIDIADKWEQPSIIRGFLKELKELIE